MDIALFVINQDTNELQYSGAYNPLYIVRTQDHSFVIIILNRILSIFCGTPSSEMLAFRLVEKILGIHF